MILFAHPALELSRVNVPLVDAVRGMEGVTFQDLYEAYPDFDVDVAREKRLMEQHPVVIFQHPVYWYSSPALLKQWEDLVLEHGWAFGSGGTALRGKTLLSVLTAGGGEEAYCRDGYNQYTMRELLTPFEQTARLCGMRYLPPFVVHGTHSLTEAEIAVHASDYRRVVAALRNGTLDFERAAKLHRLNAELDEILPVEAR